MALIGVFAGPGHVLVDGSPEYRALVPPDAFGRPIVETWTDPAYRAMRCFMDEVYRTGEGRTLAMSAPEHDGLLTVTPICDQGRVVGLATHWRALGPRMLAGTPPSRLELSD